MGVFMSNGLFQPIGEVKTMLITHKVGAHRRPAYLSQILVAFSWLDKIDTGVLSVEQAFNSLADIMAKEQIIVNRNQRINGSNIRHFIKDGKMHICGVGSKSKVQVIIEYI